MKSYILLILLCVSIAFKNNLPKLSKLYKIMVANANAHRMSILAVLAGTKNVVMSAYPRADLFDEITDPNKNVGKTASVRQPDKMPSTYNWVTKDNRIGYSVIQGAPKHQGACGSCWAVASTTVFESYLCLNHNQCKPLDTDFTASCSSAKITVASSFVPDDRVDGCAGSNAVMALHYLRMGNGLKFQTSFYSVPNGGIENLIGGKAVCSGERYTLSSAKGSTLVDKVKQYIWAHGPAMTKIDGTQLNDYKGATITESSKCNAEAEHSVVIVGWKKDNDSKEVWIIRNSWGTEWGDNGYFYTKIDSDICGIAVNAIFLANANIAPIDRNGLNMYIYDNSWFVQKGSAKYLRG